MKNMPCRLKTSRSSLREEVDSCGGPNHLIGECPKPPKDKNQRAFIGGSWSDSGEEDDEKVKDETCLVAQASNEVKVILSSNAAAICWNSKLDDEEVEDGGAFVLTRITAFREHLTLALFSMICSPSVGLL
ncbi:hypothetical protein Tco_0889596 [Tanacetum coccineum]